MHKRVPEASLSAGDAIQEVFTPGLRVWGGDGVRVVRDLAELDVSGGTMVLGDPLWLDTAPRLAVKPKAALVRLALVRMFGVHEVAGVRVDFGPGSVQTVLTSS